MRARGAMALVALAVLAVATVAGGAPESRKPWGTTYRASCWHQPVAGTETVFVRFPRSSIITDAAVAESIMVGTHTAGADTLRSVSWAKVSITDLGGATSFLKIVIYGDAFPGGVDTLRVTRQVKEVEFGGFTIDSLAMISTSTSDDWEIVATD